MNIMDHIPLDVAGVAILSIPLRPHDIARIEQEAWE